jgi:integrase/recombinase XerD
MKNIAAALPLDLAVAEYEQHLLGVAGLTSETCRAWTFYVRRFLTAQFKPKALSLDWSRVTAVRLSAYLQEQSHEYSLTRLQCLASALRSYCRFLCLSGHCLTDLSAAIPQVASPGRADLPRFLSHPELEKLLASSNGHSAARQRNHAIVLCIARLGVRAGEVAGLNLEDIDWRRSLLRLAQTKGRRQRQLPLPADVGDALAKYLKQARPKTASRAVFVSLRQGDRLTPDAVSAITVAAFKRARLSTPRPGAHCLRHTVASHLVQRGVSLKAVADLLGHASLSTTQVYAKVNLPLLRPIPLPWPGCKEVRA